LAYLRGDLEDINIISDDDRLGTGCVEANRYFVNKVEVCGIYGNPKLVFIPLLNSFSNETSLGQKTLLVILRNVSNKWKLLTVTDDPVSLSMFDGPVQKLAKRLKEKNSVTESRIPEPATLLTPDWEFPAPVSGERFGNFVWRPSPSEDVVAEILEFEAGSFTRRTRLFLFFDKSAHERKLSTGKLVHTGGTWHWRVWSISENSSLALSDYRSFIH